MTPRRFVQLSTDVTLNLTPEEIAEGWHWCYDWDCMLVNRNDTEGEGACCTCELTVTTQNTPVPD